MIMDKVIILLVIISRNRTAAIFSIKNYAAPRKKFSKTETDNFEMVTTTNNVVERTTQLNALFSIV